MKRPFIYGKRIAAATTACVLLVGTTAMAEGTALIEWNGKGRITSDANGDGVDDVIYDASDISALVEASEQTYDNISFMEDMLKQTIADAGDARQKVIDAYNKKSFVDDIAKGANADTVANTIRGTKEWPVVVSYAAGTGNQFTSKGKPSKSNTGALSLEFAKSGNNIVLDVDQQVTLPAGYYAEPITVSNGVINKGSISYIFSGNGTKSFDAGYYDGGSIASSFEAAANSYNWKIRHHVHDTSVTNKYVENTSFNKTTDGPADNETRTTKGGCFTKEISHVHDASCFSGVFYAGSSSNFYDGAIGVYLVNFTPSMQNYIGDGANLSSRHGESGIYTLGQLVKSSEFDYIRSELLAMGFSSDGANTFLENLKGLRMEYHVADNINSNPNVNMVGRTGSSLSVYNYRNDGWGPMAFNYSPTVGSLDLGIYKNIQCLADGKNYFASGGYSIILTRTSDTGEYMVSIMPAVDGDHGNSQLREYHKTRLSCAYKDAALAGQSAYDNKTTTAFQNKVASGYGIGCGKTRGQIVEGSSFTVK